MPPVYTLAALPTVPRRLAIADRLRVLIVTGSAMALILADKALPSF